MLSVRRRGDGHEDQRDVGGVECAVVGKGHERCGERMMASVCVDVPSQRTSVRLALAPAAANRRRVVSPAPRASK